MVETAIGTEESNPTRHATVLTDMVCERIAPRNVYNGYPGGCAIPHVYAAETNSPESPAYMEILWRGRYKSSAERKRITGIIIQKNKPPK